jgi:DNA-binding MarR family transcriptional regulator
MYRDEDEAEDFAEAFVGLIRALGMLEPDRTPCGLPMSVAEAHALTVLRADGIQRADGTQRAGGTQQGQLAKHLNVAKSTASRLVDGLVRRGWVRREPDPHDGRACLLVLTDDGQRVAGDVVRRRAARLTTLLNQISPQRRGAVIQSLRLLSEAGTDESP